MCLRRTRASVRGTLAILERGRPCCGLQSLKGGCRKAGDRLFSRACCDRTRDSSFKLKEGRCRSDLRKAFFSEEGGGTVEQVAQRSCAGPIPGNVPGQVGQGLWVASSRGRCLCPSQQDVLTG